MRDLYLNTDTSLLLDVVLYMGNSFNRKDPHDGGDERAKTSGSKVKSQKKCNSSPAHHSKKSQGSSPAPKKDFILYGLDYLSDSEKKRELRRKGLGYIRVDNLNWSASYQHFLSQNEAAAIGVAAAGAAADQAADVLPELTIEKEYADTWPIEIPDDTGEWKIFQHYKFENLVMSGGGSKGYAYIGSLKVLEDCGILQKIKRIAGSSAGAICAGLLAVGCTPQEIANVFKCDMKWLFHDQKCAYCCYLPRLCHKYYGVHPAKRFHDIYGDHIALKVGNPDVTFSELLEKHGCELHIVVTNLSRMCSEYCNHLTCPNIPIRDAVRMSMSFPVVFRTVRYNLTGVECLYTDGGILDQYPIHCFDVVDNKLDGNSRNGMVSYHSLNLLNNKTLGLYVVAEKALDYKIWQTLFGMEIPYKPTYIPNTKLARARLKQEILLRKRRHLAISREENLTLVIASHSFIDCSTTTWLAFHKYIDELRASIGYNAVQVLDQYDAFNKGHVDITSFGEYFTTAIETLLISQRKMHVKPSDVSRTVPINCGYIGTNDYKIEPGDRRFMITVDCALENLTKLKRSKSKMTMMSLSSSVYDFHGYTCTQRFLQDYVMRIKSSDVDSGVNSEPASFHTALGSRHDTDILLNHVETLKISPHAQSFSSSDFLDKDKADKIKKAGSSVETQV